MKRKNYAVDLSREANARGLASLREWKKKNVDDPERCECRDTGCVHVDRLTPFEQPVRCSFDAEVTVEVGPQVSVGQFFGLAPYPDRETARVCKRCATFLRREGLAR